MIDGFSLEALGMHMLRLTELEDQADRRLYSLEAFVVFMLRLAELQDPDDRRLFSPGFCCVYSETCRA